MLVVEDNVELRNFISQSIGTAWRVVEATNGEELSDRAATRFGGFRPDDAVEGRLCPLR